MSLHEHNEQARAPELVERIAAGGQVALVSDAGMPLVSDPGARLVAAVLDAGLELDVLPGASSVTTAIATSGLAGGGFVFAGFLPRSAAARETALQRFDAAGLPVVVFESPRRLPATLRALSERGPERRGAVCRELTKLHQEVARGTLAEVGRTVSQRSPRRDHAGAAGRRCTGGAGAFGRAFRAGRDDRGAAGGGAGRTPYRRAAQPALSRAHREMTPPASSILQPAHTCATVILRQAGTRPAKHAHIVWGRERDGVSPHTNLEGIVDHRSRAAAGSPRG